MSRQAPDYESVARWQARLLYIVIGLLVIFGAQVANLFGGGGVGSPSAIVFMLLYWACLIVGVVVMILLMVAERKHPVVIVLLSLLAIVPIINLLVLLHVSSMATLLLKSRGAKVGLLGTPRSELPKLRAGHCAGCGYDRSGLEVLAQCPECGRVPEVR